MKASFSLYLIIEQITKKADMRYDSFFASILNEGILDFPENIRILSWNYDFQFEKAFSEYSEQKEIYNNQSFLNVITKFSYDDNRSNKFCILKLNGTTNLMQDNGFRQYHFFVEMESELDIKLIEKIIRNYAILRFNLHRDVFSGLSFAWEKYFREVNDIIKKSKNETVDTEVLIVIGYSFPYFNREIDREIIGNMKNLKKVYFQSPDVENLKERFLTIRTDLNNDQLLIRKDVSQFLLPNEL